MQGWFGLSLLSIIDTHPLMMIMASVNATSISLIIVILFSCTIINNSTIVDINHNHKCSVV